MNRKYRILILLILAVANILLYWPCSLYFLNDDLVHIPLTQEGVLFQQRSARPVHELLVQFDLWLWGKNAFGFHITALVLHFIVAVQLYFVAGKIAVVFLKQNTVKSQQLAFISTAIFLLYPQHAESLAWILGRTPTLSAIFFLAVIQLYFNTRQGLLQYSFAFLLFLLTLFTYEQVILFPIVFILHAYFSKNVQQKKAAMGFAVATALAGFMYIIARKLITTEIVGAYEGDNFNKLDLVVLYQNAARLILRLILNPSATNIFMYSSLVLIGLLTSLILYHRKKIFSQAAFLLAVSIIVVIIPVISLGVTIRSFESGRYLYIPSIFLAIGIGLWVQQLSQKYIVITGLIIVLYWGWGKYTSASHFKEASAYVKRTQQLVQQHFKAKPSDTMYMDTLKLTVHRLPVFRMGFKTGVVWLNPAVDTHKIKVLYYDDEFLHSLK